MPYIRFRSLFAVALIGVLLAGCRDSTAPSPPKYEVRLLGGFGTSRSPTYDRRPFQSYGYAISPTGQVVGMAELDAPRETFVPALWHDSIPQALFTPGMCGEAPVCQGAAYATNLHGEVVGRSGGVDVYAWHWKNGEVRRLPSLGRGFDTAHDINNRGEIVGLSDTGHYPHAALWRGSTVIDLGTLGGARSEAYAINDNSEVVGWSWDSHAQRAFVWRNGTMHALESPGWKDSHAEDISNHGQIVGWVSDGTDMRHACFWDRRGKMRRLDGTLSSAHAINVHGDIVGVFGPSHSDRRAALWRKGERYELNHLVLDSRIHLHTALDINDAGQIIAWGTLHGFPHAFLLTPVGRR